MALSIKTEEADRLARKLARLTGESMTEAVTRALAERLEREAARRKTGLADRIEAAAARIREKYDLSRPISRKEIEEAGFDSFDFEAAKKRR